MSDSESWNSGINTAQRRVRRSRADHSGEYIVNELAQAFIDETRRSRRWGIFFKFVFVLLALLAIVALFGSQLADVTQVGGQRHTARVEIRGVIGADELANASTIVESLELALSDDDTAGVILRVNSPGGSPVQSGIVYDEIIRLRNKYPGVPIHAVVGDICASGGYYIAAAADRIYADKASIVGSIGVRMDSFGFEGTLEKLGAERRLLTAGENKGILDPFSPVDPQQLAHLQLLLDGVHNQFIEAVRRGRGDRIKDDPELFSGLFWTGQQALEHGLVDELANEAFVAREIIGEPTIVDFTVKQDLAEKLMKQLSSSLEHVLGLKTSTPRLH